MTISRLCWRPSANTMSNAPVLVLIRVLVLGETAKLLVVCRYISFDFIFLGWSGGRKFFVKADFYVASGTFTNRYELSFN